jgi:hypothetical protein
VDNYEADGFFLMLWMPLYHEYGGNMFLVSTYKTTGCHIPEDHNLGIQRCEELHTLRTSISHLVLWSVTSGH